MVPVAFSYSWNIGINPVSGGNFSPIGYLYMLKGADAFHGATIVDFALGPGWDVSTTLVYTEYWYTGNESNLRLADFTGDKFSLNLSFSYYGFENGTGFTLSPVSSGGYIIGYMRQVGVGVPGPGGGVNWGRTDFYKYP